MNTALEVVAEAAPRHDPEPQSSGAARPPRAVVGQATGTPSGPRRPFFPIMLCLLVILLLTTLGYLAWKKFNAPEPEWVSVSSVDHAR